MCPHGEKDTKQIIPQKLYNLNCDKCYGVWGKERRNCI